MSDLSTYHAICWKGDWRLIPRICGGLIEVWDQTVGCAECGMNIWYLPDHDKWPAWDMENAPAENHWEAWEANKAGSNPYDIFVNLFTKIHPFQFEDCHDPGDEDRSASDTWTLGPCVRALQGERALTASVTKDDIKKLRSLADAATPGPWRYDGIDIVQLTDSGKGYPLDYYPDSKDVAIGKCSGCGNTDVGIQRRDDAAFIVAARGAVPAQITEIEQLREQVDSIPILRAENDRLTKAVNEAPEFLEAVKVATSAKSAQLRAALREALDIFDATWCPEHGHAPRPEQLARVDELRKLVLATIEQLRDHDHLKRLYVESRDYVDTLTKERDQLVEMARRHVEDLDAIDARLTAITAARDEACDIIDDPNGAGGGAEHEMAPYRRAAELRKVGST